LSNIFVSHARPSEPQARLAGDALRAPGYGVSRDDELGEEAKPSIMAAFSGASAAT
jgi:hypothetical protein